MMYWKMSHNKRMQEDEMMRRKDAELSSELVED